VTENVAFGLKRHGAPRDRIAEQVERMLTLVQLKPYARRKPHQLSGASTAGALARSLALEPKLLLLDERWQRWTANCASRPSSNCTAIIRRSASPA